MASMAPMVMVLFKWLNLMAAEPKRGDDRIDGWIPQIREEQDDELTLKIEGASTVAWLMASMVAAWMAPVASVMASMVASLDWLRLMTEPKRGEERVDGLSHKICEERVERLTHKICEERADELTFKID